MQNNILYKSKGSKRIFFVLGLLNFFITNIFLQISLFFIPIVISTALSVVVNIFIGFYLYGKFVFKSSSFNIKNFKKYLLIIFFTWILNYFFIKYMFLLGFNKNLSAIIIVPLLALISYFYQKNYVFKE